MAEVKPLQRKVGSFHIVMDDTTGHGVELYSIVQIVEVGKENYKVRPGMGMADFGKGVFGGHVPTKYMKDSDFKQLTNTKTETMKRQSFSTNQERQNAVLTVASELAGSNNNCVTTLELKLALEAKYPDVQWDQYDNGGVAGVSPLFHNLVRQGLFKSVANNGTFQIYADTSLPMPSRSAIDAVPLLVPQTVFQTVYVNKNPKATNGAKLLTALANNSVAKPKTVKQAPVAPTVNPKAPKSKAITKGTAITRTKALEKMKNNKGHFFTVEFIKEDGSLRKLNGQYIKDQTQSPLGYVLVKEASKLKAGVNPIRNVNLQTLKSLKIGGTLHPVK